MPLKAFFHKSFVSHTKQHPMQQHPQTGVLSAAELTTGRWTRDEHTRFLNAFRLYGGNWKKIATVVGSRDNIQCRTHAQKTNLNGLKHEVKQEPFQTASQIELSQVRGGYTALVKKPRHAGSTDYSIFRPLPPPWTFSPFEAKTSSHPAGYHPKARGMSGVE
jgi:SHAQKYF class myb-like DNA-binding protein